MQQETRELMLKAWAPVEQRLLLLPLHSVLVVMLVLVVEALVAAADPLSLRSTLIALQS
jgi:hypothetical protein